MISAWAEVAQLVEHSTENAGVAGSIPALGTSVPAQPRRPSGSSSAVEHFLAKEDVEGSNPFSRSTDSYLNSSLPFYHTIMAMSADLAKVEKDLISQRTKAALQSLTEKGVKLGRPKGSRDKRPRKKAGYYRRWERGRIDSR